MRLWICLHCAIMAVCYPTKKNGTEFEPEGKIVGGRPVSLRQFPSACLFFNLGAQCAGTILNSWTILTAAHCFDKNKDDHQMLIEVESRYLYDFYAKSHDVRKFVIHEDYNKAAKFACDIALIFLADKIQFSSKAKKGVIVSHNKWMKENEKFIATGWGLTSYSGEVSDKGLLMAELRYISSEDCGRMHKLNLTPDMFCLYGDGVKDTCKGDSGGGVIWNGMIVGITSHGAGCARINKPSVYANVWYFREWIKNHVQNYMDWYCEEKGKRT
ncbi:hypothetical protein ABMA27_013508 [Loxostege sticticalis]|uniref:Peptidase S1 domain-containing protein n=1 Tax=Loxostege sticticalis TaxID=481309 RepID=A0ABR3IFL9_LOXSC